MLTLPNWAKVAIGVDAIRIGVAAAVATGGLAVAIPVLIASVQVTAVSAAVGAAIGGVVSAISHRVTTGSWNGVRKAALKGAVDGAADGFMTGGIFAGATQVLSAGFRVAANLGAQTWRKAGIDIAKGIRILSPNSANYPEAGGTLLEIGENFRIDVGYNTIMHAHVGATKEWMRVHHLITPCVASGITIISGIIKGIFRGNK